MLRSSFVWLLCVGVGSAYSIKITAPAMFEEVTTKVSVLGYTTGVENPPLLVDVYYRKAGIAPTWVLCGSTDQFMYDDTSGDWITAGVIECSVPIGQHTLQIIAYDAHGDTDITFAVCP